MSVRRSPRRTPALLAANRANAKKFTGPRTALPIVFARLRVPALAYHTKSTERQTARPAHRDMRCQTRNVIGDPSGSGIFSKGAQTAPPIFGKSDFFDFHISLISGSFLHIIAYLDQPTIEKTRKNAPALTSTTENGHGLESITFRVCVADEKRESSLESVKRDCMANNVYKKGQRGMSFGINDMTLIREMWKYQKRAPCGTGMSWRINSMAISARASKGPVYLPVTSTAKTRRSDAPGQFRTGNRLFAKADLPCQGHAFAGRCTLAVGLSFGQAHPIFWPSGAARWQCLLELNVLRQHVPGGSPA